MSPVSEERSLDTSLLVSFWSLEQLSCVERYHIGQFSIARYVDSRVNRGASHLAIICDSEVLKEEELDRTYEVTSAITSMCARPVSIRTLTSLRREDSIDRSRANRVALRLQELEIRAKRYFAEPHLETIRAWKKEEINGERLLDTVNFLSVDEEKLLSPDEAASLMCLLLHPPAWYDRFWFASAQFAINQISSEVPQHIDNIEIVEASRNRYVWLARSALERLCPAEFPKSQTEIRLNLRPNIQADGPAGFMCLKERNSALFLHSSNEAIADFCDSASQRVADSISRHLLDHQESIDRRTLALETAKLLVSMQGRWIFGKKKIGYARVAQHNAIEATPKAVVSIHGVQSRGTWQRTLDERLSEVGVICVAEDLGHLQPWTALSRGTAVEMARHLTNRIAALKSRNKGKELLVSVVAHSFGTRVLGVALENLGLEVDKVVLSGSVLPRSFKWHDMLDSGRVGCVVNIAASHDRVVSLAGVASKVLVPEWLGPSGKEGFTTAHPKLIQRRVPDLRHSDIYDESFFSRILVPFLVGNEPLTVFEKLGTALNA